MQTIGSSQPVLDATAKVTGKTKYVADLKFSQMLYAKVLFSPIAHGKIININTSKAEQLPGVHAVLTYKNTAQIKFSNNTETVFTNHPRYVGDRIAAVAADTLAIAAAAIKLITVEYEELPFYLRAEDALATGASFLHEDSNLAFKCDKEAGDVAEALANASRIIESSYELPAVHHSALETHAAIAGYNNDNRLEIYTNNYAIADAQEKLAPVLGLSCNQLQLKSCTIGGAFGGKVGLILEPVVALLAMHTKHYVKLVYSRKDTICSTGSRHGMCLSFRTSIDDNKQITALEVIATINAGAYGSQTPNISHAVGRPLFQNYQIPNIRYYCKAAYTNTLPGLPMRGFGDPQITFALERHMDYLAIELCADPVEIRKAYLKPQYSIDSLSKKNLGKISLQECFKTGLKAFRWYERLSDMQQKQSSDYYEGIGFAVANHANGVAPTGIDHANAFLQMFADGSVALLTGAGNQGGGSHTIFTQIIAEILQLPLKKVSLLTNDSLFTPYDFGAIASRNTFVVGKAVERAASALLKQIKDAACQMWEIEESALEFSAGKFTNLHTKNTTSYQEIFQFARINLHKRFVTAISFAPRHNAATSCAHFAALRVCKTTGQVTLLDYLTVSEIGKILNPILLNGQVEGGVQMGIGYALSEGLRFEPQSGKISNSSLKNHPMPHAKQLPIISNLFLEEIEIDGPFGAKGIGEACTVPVAPAIINALSHALGVQFTKLPVTQNDILQVLKNKSDVKG